MSQSVRALLLARAGLRPAEIARRMEVTVQRVDHLLHPEKYHARRAVYDGLRRGRIVRPARCERCGGADPQAHHLDYSRRLLVAWLCRGCHVEEHAAAQSREAA